MFGTKRRIICSDCLGQFKIRKQQIENQYVVLEDRYAKEDVTKWLTLNNGESIVSRDAY